MENDNTTDTTNTDTQAPPAENGDAGAQTVTPPVVEPPAPVIPDGYVKVEDVEAERTARTAAESARTEAEAKAVAAEARARTAEIKAAAQKLGFADANDAALYVGGDVADIEGALASVLEAKPYLKGAVETAAPPVTPTSPTNPARVATVTLDSLKAMTAKQIAALPKDMVWAALKR